MTQAQSLVNEQLFRGFKKPISSVGYYVYAITKNDIVVYIGKGVKNRVLQHFKNSSNHRLFSEMKNNKKQFDWYILSYFDEQHEALEFEYNIITDAKIGGLKLYNKTHYSNSREFNSGLKLIYFVLKQYENMWFKVNTLNLYTCPKRRAETFLRCLKIEFENYSEKPMYKNKPFTELSLTLSFDNEWVQMIIS